MQANQSQIRERFSQVEQCVDNAAQMCEMSNDVPDRLRTCLSELEQESDHAIQVAEQQQSDRESPGGGADARSHPIKKWSNSCPVRSTWAT